MSNDADQLTAEWGSRPLCRRYATAVFRRAMLSTAATKSSRLHSIWWALGTLNDGGAEFLGVWENADERAGPLPDVFGQLRDRGVLSIRFCIGNIGGAETAFRQALRHAANVPSVQELLLSSVELAKPRHRLAVQEQLRAIAKLEDLGAVRSEFARFQGSKLGERYPEIIRQWNEVLARLETLYALHAPLRELVRSADRTAADVSERLNRAIKRHGPFTDSATALDFVVACLGKTERGLARDHAARPVLHDGSSPRRDFRLTAGVPGVPALA